MGEKIISKNFLAALIVFIFLSLVVVQVTGLAERYDFIDRTLHFLGGVWLAIFFFVYFNERPELFDLRGNKKLTAFFALGAVALIGVGWEFFEYIVGVLTGDYWIGTGAWGLDTLEDLFLDLVGASAVSLIF